MMDFSRGLFLLLNLLNELEGKDDVRLHRALIEFHKFSNSGGRMQDSVYQMTLKSHFISDFCTKMSRCRP